VTAAVLGAAALLLGGAFAGLARLGDLAERVWTFEALFVVASLGYAMAVVWVLRRPPTGWRALGAIGAASVVFRLLLLPTPPTLSTDVYRYLWDGRLQVAGVSPYALQPDAPALAAHRDAVIYPHLNHRSWRTVYPPGAQLIFAAMARLAPASVFAFKVMIVAADLATVACLVAWLGALGRPRAWALVYAWHPLVVVELAGAGHLDAIALLASVAALWAATRGREGWAGAALGLGALVKLYPLLLLPAVWRRRPLRVLAAALAVVAAGYLVYARDGAAVIGTLPRFLAEEEFNATLRVSLEWLAGPFGEPGRLAARAAPLLTLAVVATAVGWVGREVPPGRRAFWLVAGYLVATPSLFPWYALWLVPILAVAPRWPWLWLTCSVALAYLVFAEPVWRIPGWVRVAEFGPVVLGLAWPRHQRTVDPHAIISMEVSV
jgi:alpha-1,6-mannosyltransferase